MDLRYTAEYERFREGLRAFLSDNWPLRGPDAEKPRAAQISIFRQRAIDAGYYCRSIPKKYGGSEQEPDVLKATIIEEECESVGAPPDVRPGMLVLTLLERGEEWQKEKWVAPTMRGEIRWCQGYSEPGSGSDLASLQTRAELVGDEWIINGQKIWTSGAHVADYMFCLCRTEPDAPKHAGISYLLIDMKQPGIEVRPLQQMTGASSFNQVFFTDARTPRHWIVGKRGEGWQVSRTTLKHERNGLGNAARAYESFESVLSLAKRVERGGRPAIEDPEIRQRLATIEGYVRSHMYSGYIQLTRNHRGENPGILQLMNKLLNTNISHDVVRLGLDLIESDGLTQPEPRRGTEIPRTHAGWVTRYMGSLGSSIAGGTSNVQRNVIAERGLGLPRDEAASRS
jgi:alkylation response protein AidB-like acyl-CoA dehydrogenase